MDGQRFPFGAANDEGRSSGNKKKAAHVKWAGKTIALGSFPHAEAKEKCERAKALTRSWRTTLDPKPSREWVIAELERLRVRDVERKTDRLPPIDGISDEEDGGNGVLERRREREQKQRRGRGSSEPSARAGSAAAASDKRELGGDVLGAASDAFFDDNDDDADGGGDRTSTSSDADESDDDPLGDAIEAAVRFGEAQVPDSHDVASSPAATSGAATPMTTALIPRRYKPQASIDGGNSESDRLRARLERSEAKIVELNMTLRTERLARQKAEDSLEEENEWSGYLVRLLRYGRENGDTAVPRRYEEDGRKGSLGWWVSHLRRLRREKDGRGKEGRRRKEAAGRYLTQARIEILDAMGFSWNGSKSSAAAGGDAETDEAESELTAEQVCQRKREENRRRQEECRRRKKEMVEAEEREEWNSFFCRLAKYHAEEGDCNVPSTYGGGKKGSLGFWVKRMRQLKREKETGLRENGGCLTEDRIKMLDSLSFRWQAPGGGGGGGSSGIRRMSRKDERPWEDMFSELLVYRAEKGDVNVPMSYGGGQIGSLGHWCRRLKARKRGRERNQLSEDVLTDEQIRKLDEVGFVWSVPREDLKQKFEDRIKELCRYKAIHGHVCPPIDKSSLGKWVHYQRGRYRERLRKARYIQEHNGSDAGYKRSMASISQEEIDRLNQIGFVWLRKPVPDLGWDAQYEELLAYRAEHGHCDVPQSYKGQRTLGRWVMRQRVLYGHRKIGKLKPNSQMMTDERIAKLEAIGFKWSMVGAKRKREEQYEVVEESDSDTSDHDEEEQYGSNQYGSNQYVSSQYGSNQYGSNQYGLNVGNFVM